MTSFVQFQVSNHLHTNNSLTPLHISKQVDGEGQTKAIHIKIDSHVRDAFIKLGKVLLATVAISSVPAGLTIICLTGGFLAKNLNSVHAKLDTWASEQNQNGKLAIGLGAIAATVLTPGLVAIYAAARIGGTVRTTAENNGWM